MKTYIQGLNEALDEALSEDKNVFLFGEDIAVYGGCFGVTRGLLDKHGQKRVVDSPMSESTITGLGVGSAVAGLRPVVEIMFMDFCTLIYDQLFNHGSIFAYMTNGEIKVPLVIRVPAGAGRGYGATHSKTLIAPLMNIPGIKIVAPYRASEVKALLKESIKDDNIVVFVEHKLLYTSKEDCEEAKSVPLGKAAILREGSDITIVSFSKMLQDCMAAAQKLEAEGISAEVIDLRTIKPLDMDTITKSVEKTKKLLVVEEGFGMCGVGAEITARVVESSFYSLEAPIARLAGADVPISCASSLEKASIPNPDSIAEQARRTVNG